MQALHTFIDWFNGIVWGVPMIVMILGTGLYLNIRLRFMPLLKIGHGFKMIWAATNPLAFGFPSRVGNRNNLPLYFRWSAELCGQPSLDLTFPSDSEITRGGYVCCRTLLLKQNP